MRAAFIFVLLMLVACSAADEPETAPPPTNIADNGLPVVPTPTPARRRPDATGPGTAMGLTYLQLEDADLVDASGATLGEVERIDADAAGTITALIVELTDGRMVRLGLAGLSITPDGDDWNLRTTQTPADLAALPAVTR
jgi:hypothetical protein